MISRPLWAAMAGLSLFTLSLASAPPAFGSPPPCGQIGQTCCPFTPGPECQAGATCIGMTCVACGGVGEFCCVGEECETGLTCLPEFNESLSGQGGGAAVNPIICQPCGGDGEPCCDSMCDSGFVCEPCLGDSIAGQGSGAGFDQCIGPDICEPCGGLKQRCCDGETCNEGFDCLPVYMETVDQGAGASRVTACFPCGTLGEPCCDEQTCLGDSLLCGGEFCEACGRVGEQCCEDNTCPASGGICAEGICEPLPPAAAMSNSGLALLIMTLTGIGLLWMRRAEA